MQYYIKYQGHYLLYILSIIKFQKKILTKIRKLLITKIQYGFEVRLMHKNYKNELDRDFFKGI
jgi:hypothetical protein